MKNIAYIYIKVGGNLDTLDRLAKTGVISCPGWRWRVGHSDQPLEDMLEHSMHHGAAGNDSGTEDTVDRAGEALPARNWKAVLRAIPNILTVELTPNDKPFRIQPRVGREPGNRRVCHIPKVGEGIGHAGTRGIASTPEKNS